MSPKLQDLPDEFLPREKLVRHGRESLSASELIAILLRTGTAGCNVLDVSAELIRQAGSLDALARMEASDISGLIKGIGSAKAATLAAAFELGARAIQEASSRIPLSSPDAVYDYLIKDTRRLDQEGVFVLLLDTRSCIIRKCTISLGSLNESIAHPRDILRPAIVHQAHAFILAHNHPSGNPAPSRADDQTTTRIADAAQLLGIQFYDHIIMGTPTSLMSRNYYSYKASGMLGKHTSRH